MKIPTHVVNRVSQLQQAAANLLAEAAVLQVRAESGNPADTVDMEGQFLVSEKFEQAFWEEVAAALDLANDERTPMSNLI